MLDSYAKYWGKGHKEKMQIAMSEDYRTTEEEFEDILEGAERSNRRRKLQRKIKVIIGGLEESEIEMGLSDPGYLN